jgi:tRNA1(Val) A37 N6-methylase TrmN6
MSKTRQAIDKTKIPNALCRASEKTRALSEVRLEGDERLDALCEGRWIIQRARGHKATTDDQLLAWACLRALNELKLNPLTFGEASLLELGAGKGTVTLWLSRQLSGPFVGLETFEQSYQLSLKNRTLNKIESCFFPLHADLRTPESWREARVSLYTALTQQRGHTPQAPSPSSPSSSSSSEEALPRFTLICGAPPFMPLGSGVMPQDPQRAAGRFELKGGVEGYLDAVVACLDPTGRALILVDGLGEERAIRAAQARELEVLRVTRVCPRPQQPATYAILSLSLSASLSLSLSASPPLIEVLYMREQEGEAWSEAYQQALSQLKSSSPSVSS